MATDVTLRINHSIIDTAYADQDSAVNNFIDVDDVNDIFYFNEGSDVVADGEVLPSETDLNRAATLVSAIAAVEVGKYFLGDASDGLLKEIFLAGSGNYQYVFCCSFDGDTATEPQLEAWDDDDMDSILLQTLGLGTPANSWYKGICTTTNPPGAAWTGTPLAGSGASNVILLNDGSGALALATDLYFNFHISIPAGSFTPAIANPVLAIIYTTN
jgi:hypothetical protein